MKYLTLFPIVLFFACGPSPQRDQAAERRYPAAFVRVVERHGGLETWNQQRQLSFNIDGEHHQVDLKSRRIRIDEEGGAPLIGFDRQEVWTTDSSRVERARFYHNLYFYFFAMPFVLADPGIRYDSVPSRTLLGKSYPGIKVAYGDSIGDSPDDNYILLFDPETRQMEWLMYTVTFGSSGPSDGYNLIHYAEWQDVSGLLLPTLLQWHHYQNDSVGAVRGEAVFSEISLSAQPLPDGLFEKPKGAWIAPK